jgi:putative cobalt transporter subunit CbtB
MTETTLPSALPARIDARVLDCALASFYLLLGGLLVYLVLLDQGAAVSAIFGAAGGHRNYLHELFHDGRHLANAPCH